MAKNIKKNQLNRLAIVDPNLCKPTRCHLECFKSCPVNRTNKKCIVVEKIAEISETLCIGCGICIKRCPFNAIKIINLPVSLEESVSHRFSKNGFKLHHLPIPKPGNVLGLVGSNGIGKSTAINILSTKIRPNLGKEKELGWTEILNEYKGTELHLYLTKIIDNDIKVAVKMQYIDELPKILLKNYNLCILHSNSLFIEECESCAKNEAKNVTVKVKEILKKKLEENYCEVKEEIIKIIKNKENIENYENKKIKKVVNLLKEMEIIHLLNRNVDELSGGELQRLAITLCCLEEAQTYIFDEPSSFLDVKQRINMVKTIRGLLDDNVYVIVVEHDLTVLDMLCDYGAVMYGESGAYGVITKPFSIKMAINVYLNGMIPTENVRFRKEALVFNEKKNFNENEEIVEKIENKREYPKMEKNYGENKNKFNLTVENGEFKNSEVVVLLGENGMGKTTMINLIAGRIKPDKIFLGNEIIKNETIEEKIENMNLSNLLGLKISMKPQKIQPKYKGTVKSLFMSVIRVSFLDSNFIVNVLKPLSLVHLYDRMVNTLSGGELQRVAIAVCLGREADLYLIDEPSAYLDSDQRIAVSKVIKRFIISTNKSAFIVEHDLLMTTYLADKIVVFEGKPGIESLAKMPLNVEEAMNLFLKKLGITFRREENNYRPRVNKIGSQKDMEQKENNRYFF